MYWWLTECIGFCVLFSSSQVFGDGVIVNETIKGVKVEKGKNDTHCKGVAKKNPFVFDGIF